MRFTRSFLVIVLAVLGGMAEARVVLPPITGEIGGNFTLKSLKGMPPIAWKIRSEPMTDGSLKTQLTATAPGFELEIEAMLSAETGAGIWQVRKGTLDAAVWARIDAIRTGLKSLPEDFHVTGELQFSGGGRWDGANLSGEVTAKLADATASSAIQGWEIKDIAYESTLILEPGNFRLRLATLRAATLTAANVSARNLYVEAIGDLNRITVTRADVEVLDGKISLKPFDVELADPSVKTTAQFSQVAIGLLIQYLPAALSEAKGQVGGNISIDWSARLGLQAAGGALVMSRESPTSIRLAASPGFLTGNMPKRIVLLPAWTGPLSKWIAFDNPAYEMLQNVELGRTGLRVDELSVQLYPDGPNAPRSVHIEITARPSEESLIKTLKFEVNVSGPIDPLIKLGTDERSKIKASVNMGK